MKVLIYIQSNDQKINPISLETLAAAQQLKRERNAEIYGVTFSDKIANDLASQLKASALITGESVGQVASQTLSNIRAVSQESDLPILRPLAGTNKEDIVNRAKKIGTYDISIEPYEDCCSYFVPAHPETKAKMDKVKKISDNLIIDDIYSKTMQNIEKIEIEYTGE